MDKMNASLSLVSTCSSNALYCTENGYEITVFYFVINVLAALTGLVVATLNFFILFLMSSTDFIPDVTILFIKNLVVSDAIGGIFLMYNVLYNLLHYKVFYECVFRFGVLNTIFLNSFTLLLGLTVDRYVKIVSPYTYLKYFNNEKASKCVFCIWTFSIFSGLLPLVGWNKFNEEIRNKCGYFLIFDNAYLMYLSLYAMLGFTVLCCLYLHIFCIALSKHREEAPYGDQATSLQLWWRPTKTVFIVISINAVAIFPIASYLLCVTSGNLQNYTSGEQGTHFVYITFPAFFIGIVNPVLYALKIPFVRRRVRRYWGAFYPQAKVDPSLSIQRQTTIF